MRTKTETEKITDNPAQRLERSGRGLFLHFTFKAHDKDQRKKVSPDPPKIKGRPRSI